MEVDYTEKLNFSDDEENQASKDKRDWWVDLAFLLHLAYVCIHHPSSVAGFFLINNINLHSHPPVFLRLNELTLLESMNARN